MKTPHSVCSNPLLESLLLKEQPYLSGMSPPSRHTACLCPTHPFKLMAILLRRTASQCCPYTCLGSPQPPSAPFGEKAINKGWKALVSVYLLWAGSCPKDSTCTNHHKKLAREEGTARTSILQRSKLASRSKLPGAVRRRASFEPRQTALRMWTS